MTLQDIIADIHAIQEDLEMYERKYGVLSETFYELYSGGEELEDNTWVLDSSDWAGAYRILLRRQEQYRRTVQALQIHLPRSTEKTDSSVAYPFWGKPLTYHNPTEPVADHEWDILS